jgi:hypothetical protein
MKKQIDWLEIKDGDEFQSLCNKLLVWDVSKDVIPLGAKGRDKGTDAKFNGTYNDKTGEWRFQDKFHDPTMDKGKARSLVKSDFKKELEKIKDENPDFYIFITNVKLTKTIHDDLMIYASKYNFEVHIWDGEKLESILPKYPFIIAYHFGHDLPLFEPYQEKYKAELEGIMPVINHTCSFHGRENELELVKELMVDDRRKILLISGNSGTGKTRIGIEAAKLIETAGEWTPLFVRNDADKFDDHLHELTGEERYVIILDDAESYQHTNKLINLTIREGWSEKIKLLILCKPQNTGDIKKKIYPPYDTANVIEATVGTLSNEDTIKSMVDAGIKEETDQRRLFRICKDSPVLTIMAAKLYLEGVEPAKMSQEEIVSISLDKTLDRLRDQGKQKHLDFLDILSAISPISIRADSTHQKIAEYLKIVIGDENQIIQDLVTEGIITTRGGKLRIIPGLLADHILYKKCYDNKGQPTGYHQSIIQDFMTIAPENIINNLSAIEYKAGNDKDLLSDFADEIIKLMPTADNIQRLNILELLDTFAYYRPFDILEIIDQIIKNPQPDTISNDKNWGEMTFTHDMVQDKLPTLLSNASYTLDALPSSLNLLKIIALEEKREQFLGRSAHEKLKEICKIKYERDIWIRNEKNMFYYSEIWHESMLETFSTWLSEDDEKLQNLTLDLMDNLLDLECSYARTSLEDPGKFMFGTVRILRTQNLNDFRGKILAIIFDYLTKAKYISARISGYGLLGSALREILNHIGKENEDHKKCSEMEKDSIIAAFEKGIEEQTNLRIINRIEAGLRPLKRMCDEDKNRADNMIVKIAEKPEYKLYKCLLGQHHDYDVAESPEFWTNLAKEYTEKYTSDELSSMMIRIFDEAEQGWKYGASGHFMIQIGENFSDYGIKLLDQIIKEKNRLLEYAGCLLSGIRYHDNQTALKMIKDLKNDDDIRIKIIAIDSYERMRGFKDFSQEDMDILKELSTIDDETIKLKIADVLTNLHEVNKLDYIEILKNVSNNTNARIAGEISDAIASQNLQFTDQEFETIKQIADSFLEIDDLDKNNSAFYRIETLFNLIADKDPDWPIGFLEKRIEQFDEKKKESQDYDAIPYSLFHAFKDLKKNEKYKDILRRVRDWTLKGGWYFFEAPKVLKNLCATEGHQSRANLNEDMAEILMEWVVSKDKNKMENVAYILGEFREDERYYRIVKELIIESDGDPEILGDLSTAIYSSLGTTTRTRGQPSQKLVKRIEYLTMLRDITDNFKVKRFAEKQIKYTNEEMRQELERDEGLNA